MKNFRSTLLLAAVVIGLFCYLFFIDPHQKGTADRERAQTVLFDIDPAKISSVKITDPEGAVTLEKKDGKEGIWRIEQPVKTDADPAAVQEILDGLQQVQSRRSIAVSDLPQGNQTLQQWGLSPGNSRIEFSGEGISGVLIVGRKTAVNELVYARASRDAPAPIFLIPVTSRDAIDKKLADLRSHVVFKLDPAKVERCGLQTAPAATGAAAPSLAPTQLAPAQYELDRQGKDWKWAKPLAAPASAARVSAWLGQLGGLKVKQFISDDASNLSSYGLSSPVSQIWVQNEGAKAPETLLIGVPVPSPTTATPAPAAPGAAATGEVYAKRLEGDSVFTLAAADVGKLIEGLPNTRDRHLLAFDPKDVQEFKIEQPAPQDKDKDKAALLAIQKRGDGWIFEAPADGTADAQRVQQFLQQLASVEAVKIASDTTSDLKPYGLDHPSFRLSLTVKKGDHTENVTFLVGSAKNQPGQQGELYAQSSQQPFVYAVDPGLFDKLPTVKWPWLDPKVGDLKADRIQGVTVISDAGVPFTVTRSPGQETFQTDRAGAKVNPAEAGAQWSLLANLHAVRWLGPPQAAFGLAKPIWKITVTADAPFVLLIGADLPGGGKAAQVEGQPYAFSLSDTDVEALTMPPFGVPGAAAAQPASAPAPTPSSITPLPSAAP